MKLGKNFCASLRWNKVYVFVPNLIQMHIELRHQRRVPPGPFFVVSFEATSPKEFLRRLLEEAREGPED